VSATTAVTWGLLVDAAPAAAYAVPEGLDGLVLVDGEVVTLARAVAALPEPVTAVVELDTASLEAWDPRQLADLLGALTASDELTASTRTDAPVRVAVTASSPMADALKRVEGERVLGGLARDGLHVPRLPCAYRRDALVEVAASGAGTHTDGALLVALRTAGGGVAMLLTDGSVLDLEPAPAAGRKDS